MGSAFFKEPSHPSVNQRLTRTATKAGGNIFHLTLGNLRKKGEY